MNNLVKKILQKRGFTSEEEIAEFLSPFPRTTYDSFLLKGMREGVDVIKASIEKGEHITIYGDYDCDGVTSTVIMLTILKACGAENVDYYIPSRFYEGYGLNNDAIDKLKEKGTDLIITVDCGSVSFNEVKYAHDLGIKTVITDHHNCQDGTADTIVINPKQSDCTYPCEVLAGCGVAYKLALALRDEMGVDKAVTNRLLDLVAIGTIGDIVPLIDENRTLVKYGLREVNNSERIGLKMLMEAISIADKPVGSEQVSFGIVPNINAAGRMEIADYGVELFMAQSEEEAKPYLEKILNCNQDRKKKQQQALDICLSLQEEYIDGYNFPIIVAEGAHEGICGIVAGNLKDKFDKPIAIVSTFEDDYYRGTARCVDKINLYDVLNSCDGIYERFGGHKGACGFLIKKEHFETLRNTVNKKVDEMLLEEKDLLKPYSDYDLVIDCDDVSIETVEELEILGPFGNSNEKPKFYFPDMKITNVFFMGDNGIHAKIRATMGSGRFVDFVLFRRAQDYADILQQNNTVNIIGYLNINEWQGRKSIQVIVDKIV